MVNEPSVFEPLKFYCMSCDGSGSEDQLGQVFQTGFSERQLNKNML